MAYEDGKTYWICPINNTDVALSVRGLSQVSQNRDVFLYTKEDVGDQLWHLEIGNGFARLKSGLNQNYALNIYLGTSNYNNCDIHTWADNLEDSKINFRTVDAGSNTYRIQNYRNDADNDLYLTAQGTTSESDVVWAKNNSSDLQVWKLIEKTSSGSTGTTGGGKGPYGDYVYPTFCRKYSQGYTTAHPALDIRDKATNHNIYAFADGIVSFVQSANSPDPGTDMWTMGNCVAINHNNPITTRSGSYARTIYMHMRDVPTLKPGDTVSRGQKIGVIGTTGHSTGNHLHFSVSTGNGTSLKPGYKGWISIRDLPDFNPTLILPEYYYDPN